MPRNLIAIALMASTAAVPAAAQTTDDNGTGETMTEGSTINQIDPGRVVPLGAWSQTVRDELSGWSVRALRGSDVYGPSGEEIGAVEDIIVGPEGNLTSLVAEVGGFWDIGDTHVNVPWDQVEIRIDDDDGFFDTDIEVTIPVSEDNVDDFGLFTDGDPIALGSGATGGVDDVDFGDRAWRTSELIGDYARLVGADGPVTYGYVTDLMIENDQVAATIVNAGYPGMGGYYAYPNYAARGYGWQPGSPYYDLPYDPEQIEALEPMERRVYN
ncbi:PRC-barrel domain-containing protein [Roseitalea porphyridii]|uniref:PRC-barrel domain containing protein n=1 Tax=Roseitalea porphyridii TaxID=1852022 RepID=A0A4V1A3L5_9HYPH|nr:PRC-barrel domain-containing protein [Roseitalea porphyridii]QBK29538.1 PRC-barrel domain containing protein [Roseitalea porphyridii]